MIENLTIGVFGGTGPQGRGLAWRFAAAGLRVLVGSRDAERAIGVADELNRTLPVDIEHQVRGEENVDVAEHADLSIVSVPWDGHEATVTGLRERLGGKIVVDCVVPLGFDKQGAYLLDVPEGSAAQQALALLPDARVTAAFHHVSAVQLNDPAVSTVDCDVLVLGDDREATDTVQELASKIPGMRGIYGGRLRNARQVEGLTANLVSVNRRYKAHASIKVTDV